MVWDIVIDQSQEIITPAISYNVFYETRNHLKGIIKD